MSRPLLLVASTLFVLPAAAADLTPRGEPAARYNDPGAALPGSPLAARLGRELTGLTEDKRLDAAAADLAALVGAAGDVPPYTAVDFALSYRGVIEPTPRVVLLTLVGDDQEKLAADLRARLKPGEGQARFGVGSAPTGPGASRVVVLLLRSGIHLDAVPRTLAKGGTLKLHGDVIPPRANPRVLLTRQDGSVERLTVTPEGAQGFSADVGCGDAAGKIKVEITAMSPGRPSVLANFPVWCGAEPPRSFKVPEAAAASANAEPPNARKSEQEMISLVNEDRRRANLPPLAWDERSAAVARAHSTEMRDKNYVAHISPTTGTTADRIRAAGVATPVVLENLGLGVSAEEVEIGLMNSPGHRGNILSPQATHLGVGVAVAAPVAGRTPQIYVTQVFIREGAPVDPAAAVKETRAAIDKARAAAKAPALAWDETLARLADEHAAKAAAAGDADKAPPMSAKGLGGKYGEMQSQVTVTAHPPDAARGTVLDPAFKMIGVGIRQGAHAAKGAGTFYVVTLVAKGT